MKEYFNKKNLIIVVLTLSGYLLFTFQLNRYNNLNDKYDTEILLRNAMQDTIKTYDNKYGEVVDEKLTLQGNLKRINELYDKLTDNQKELVDRLNNSEKDRKILAAANVKLQFEIDSLRKVISAGVVDTLEKTITFKENTPEIRYEFVVSNVLPYNKNINVEHKINYLYIPNEQSIEFHYDKNKRKDNFPISFSITNTNKYMKTYDIDSYIIPEIDVKDMEKNIFRRTWDWYERQSTLVKIGIGVGGGFIIGRNL